MIAVIIPKILLPPFFQSKLEEVEDAIEMERRGENHRWTQPCHD